MESILKTQFKHYFGEPAEGIYSAPGRVNLIGEHTDYNDGFVLPLAINFYTCIAASKTDGNTIDVVALDELDEHGDPGRTQIILDAAGEKDNKSEWANYLRGVIVELQGRGMTLVGANLVIKGNVPRGAGLSSSAALENVVIKTLCDLAGHAIDGKLAAQLGQAAENNFVGCRCGIMDQMVSAIGQKNHALMLDCRTLETESIPLSEDFSVIIINSNVKRGLVDSEYNTRRQQCEQAADHFRVNALRDVGLDDLDSEKEQLEPVVYKRAKHVVTENQRVLDAAEALKHNDIKTLGRLMFDSHESMKNDFEITVPPIDTLVDIVRETIGEDGGVRMTGGGFGGCVVAYVPAELEASVVDIVNSRYKSSTGYDPDIFVCKSSDGAFV